MTGLLRLRIVRRLNWSSCIARVIRVTSKGCTALVSHLCDVDAVVLAPSGAASVVSCLHQEEVLHEERECTDNTKAARQHVQQTSALWSWTGRTKHALRTDAAESSFPLASFPKRWAAEGTSTAPSAGRRTRRQSNGSTGCAIRTSPLMSRGCDRRQPKQAVAAYTGYRWPGASRASSVLKGQAGAGGFRCQSLSSGIPKQCVGAASATRWR